MTATRCVASSRVSTDRQGKSGRGLEAQQQAVVAAHERDRISECMRAALAAKKARGFTLGCPCSATGAALGVACRQRQADRFARNLLPVIESITHAGMTTWRGRA